MVKWTFWFLDWVTGCFLTVCSRHLLLHLCSQIAHPQHLPPLWKLHYSEKSVVTSNTTASRLIPPLKPDGLFKEPACLNHLFMSKFAICKFHAHREETVRRASRLQKASPLPSPKPERWRTRSSISTIPLLQLASFTRPSVCWPSVDSRNILLHHSVRTSKKGIFWCDDVLSSPPLNQQKACMLPVTF